MTVVEPIDEAHRISINMLAWIREMFDIKKAEINSFEHTLAPPEEEPEAEEIVEEVTEWKRPRPWFRT